jgi:hypothetical protein
VPDAFNKLKAGEPEMGFKLSDMARQADRVTIDGAMVRLAELMHVPKYPANTWTRKDDPVGILNYVNHESSLNNKMRRQASENASCDSECTKVPVPVPHSKWRKNINDEC